MRKRTLSWSMIFKKFRYRSIAQNAIGVVNHWLSPPMCVFCFSVLLYLLLGGYRALPRLVLHLREVRMPSISFEPRGARMTILYYRSLLFDPQLVKVETKNNTNNSENVPESHVKEHNIGYYGELPPWLPGCKMFYVDLGANNGLALQVLYEPGNWNDSVLNEDIKEKFGSLENKFVKKHLCFLGFEPNPKLLKELFKVVKRYSSKGYNSYVFPFAVWNENELLTLFSEFTWRKRIWGASMFKSNNAHHRDKPHKVKGVRLATFIKEILQSRPIPIMKMDIEGSEYAVLLDLLDQGLLCYKYIQLILVEFHNEKLYNLDLGQWNSAVDIQIRIKNQWRCRPTELKTLDEWNEENKKETKRDEKKTKARKRNKNKG